MALNRFHSNHLICVLSIVEGGVGFIKIGVVVTISRFFFCCFFFYVYHCVEYAKIRTFSDPYFPVYRQNGVRIFEIRENTDVILSICRRIQIRESPCFCVFQAVYASTTKFKCYRFI